MNHSGPWRSDDDVCYRGSAVRERVEKRCSFGTLSDDSVRSVHTSCLPYSAYRVSHTSAYGDIDIAGND